MCLLFRHMHPATSSGPPPPFQVAPPSQNFGKGSDFYFSDKELRKCVLRNLTLPDLSASEMAEHSPIVVAGSDGLWDNFATIASPSDSAATSQTLKAKLEEIVNDFFKECGAINIKALGTCLKMQTVNRMASAGGKADDLSLFVATLETQPTGHVEAGVLVPDLFDGNISTRDIERGVDRVVLSCPSTACQRRPLLSRPLHQAVATEHTVKRAAPVDPWPGVKQPRLS